MSSFAEALQLHQTGELNSEQLLAHIDQLLTATPSMARSLLRYVHAEYSGQRLSSASYAEITRHVSVWLEDRTVVSPASLRDDTVDVTDRVSRVIQLAGDIDAFRSTSVPPPSMDTPVQPVIGVGQVLLQRFRLIEQIGEGGMSRVFKAIDLRKVEANAIDPHVAVKLLTLRFEDHFRSSAVLHREAHKLQSLTHPNIVRVIDCDRDDQVVFMTMEYLPGESLKTRLEAVNQPALTMQESTRIVTRIADALEFAHRNGIVHGDLKPGNVILTALSEVKVIDFGIARFIARPLTQGDPADVEEISALTPPYASPEMLEGAKPDPRDDVYALACIAYELLTGVHPFERLPSNIARDRQLVPMRRDGLTNAQFKAISAALHFDRNKRTGSAREFSDKFGGSATAPAKRIALYMVIAAAALVAGYLLSSRTNRSTQVPSPAVATATETPGSVFRDCPTCPLMVVLPKGEFRQGTDAVEDTAFERPAHAVAIGYLFALGQHEVTVGEFREYIESTAQHVSGCSIYDGEWQTRTDIGWDTLDGGQTAVHPVSCVSWNDATGYVNWLSNRTHQQYRLATASEWEYAADAGKKTRPDPRQVCVVANVADEDAARQFPGWKVHDCRDGYARSAPVGAFATSDFGLQDMLGNVFEWVQDCWHDDYVGAPADGSAWMQGDCRQHELRGGSWFTTPGFVRSSYRNRFDADYRAATIGFRVARIIKHEP